MRSKGFLAAFGPGIIFAAAAIGVSHLVQATRAGADYGFALAGVVVLALIIKYPFFEFGPRYAAATGKSLIDGYKRIGTWAVILFLVLTFATMFTTQAAVTVVAASLGASLFDSELPVAAWSALVLAAVAMLLIFGRYALFDRIAKALMLVLVAATIAAAILAVGDPEPKIGEMLRPDVWNAAGIAFVVALVGWMPATIEVSVWHSLWSIERRDQTGHAPRLGEALLDFNIGYGLTGIIALLFLALGAWVMFGTGETFSNNSVAFAEQLIRIYTRILGDWTWPIVSVAALAAMFSTTLAVTDAYPRVWRRSVEVLLPSAQRLNETLYWIGLLVVSGGAFVIITAFADDLPGLVDIATTIAFISAPAYAFLNYRAITDSSVPPECQPARLMRVFAWIGLVCLTLFGVSFLLWRFS